MFRFTLSLHFFAIKDSRNHYDLFIDDEKNTLLHYRAKTRPKKGPLLMQLGERHRHKYINYQGPVGNRRGRLRILRQGELPESLFWQNGKNVSQFTFIL